MSLSMTSEQPLCGIRAAVELDYSAMIHDPF